MKICLKCRSFVDDDATLCPKCGQDFSEYNHCPNCGKEYLGFSYICSYCGHPLYDNVSDSEQLNSGMSQTPDNDSPVANGIDHPMSQRQEDVPAEIIEEPDDDVIVVLDEKSEPVDSQNDNSNGIGQPEDGTDQPSDKPAQPAQSTEEPDQPAEESAQPADEPAQPAQSAKEPAQSTKEPAQPAEEPDQSAEELDQPAEELDQPAEEKDQSAEELEQPSEEPKQSVQPVEEAAQPDDITGQTTEIVPQEEDEPIVVLDDQDEPSSQTKTPLVPAAQKQKKYSRRHVADQIGKKEDTKPKSKVLNLVNEDEDTETDEDEEKKERRFSKWLHWFLFLFFLAIIAAGVGAFLYYDNLISRKKEAQEKALQDSLFNLEKAKQQKIKQERATEDSLLNLQISALHETDSLDEVRKNEFRKLDSIRVDTFMTRVITDVCPSNQILARQLDGKNYIYYYTDLANPIFMLYGFDGVKKETFTVIDNIQARLVGSFVTPDRRCLIILCKDDKHDFGLAYKYNMYESTLADYESMDKEGNKCYDVGTTGDGFFMKFGNGDEKSFKAVYTSYFDKYGNFITQE